MQENNYDNIFHSIMGHLAPDEEKSNFEGMVENFILTISLETRKDNSGTNLLARASNHLSIGLNAYRKGWRPDSIIKKGSSFTEEERGKLTAVRLWYRAQCLRTAYNEVTLGMVLASSILDPNAGHFQRLNVEKEELIRRISTLDPVANQLIQESTKIPLTPQT